MRRLCASFGRPEVDDAANMTSHEEFSEFYRQTAPALRSYVARALGGVSNADDVVQEAYLRLLRRPLRLETISERVYAVDLDVSDWMPNEADAPLVIRRSPGRHGAG